MKDVELQRTVWIVDDSQTDAARVSKILSEKYHIEVFRDGAAALERLASGKVPDLLILDWMMPGMSGIDVCKYVRSSKDRMPQIPIILLTAQHGGKEIVEAFRSGASDYISKPFVDEELIARVDSQITSKDFLERALAAEEDIKSLLINSPDSIIAVDAQGKITFANNEAISLLGRDASDLVNRPLTELIPELSYRHIGLGSGEPLFPLPEIRVGERILSPSIRILPSDNAAYTTISLRDITARKNTEAKRLDFYSIIAHDLRTPITSVLLRLQSITRGRHGILPAGLIEDVQKVEASLKSQMAMINDFLELAKFEGVSYKIDKQPVNLNEIVQSTIEDFIPLLEKNDISYDIVPPTFDPIISGDSQRLSQVLANLVGNAIKFTPAHGKITVSLKTVSSNVELYVEDTGRGIERSEMENLFDRFTRTNDSVAFTTGTGLGLMIVKEIVEAHGGVVGVESELGKGSRFWIRLPSMTTHQ